MNNSQRWLDDQCSQYDYVLFDLPTSLQSNDLSYISLQMDGGRSGREDRHIDPNAIGELKTALTQSGRELIGLIVNSTRTNPADPVCLFVCFESWN